MPIISLKNITKIFKKTPTLDNISLDIAQGKITCLLGNSGSGKTTILRLIAGLEKPNKGEIVIDSRVVTQGKKLVIPPSQRAIGFIFQDLALWSHMTVYENIAFGLKLKKSQNIEQKVVEILEFFGILKYKDSYPNQISGGQQQLVAIARSLVLKPKILLMDEPLANLDIHLKKKMRNQIKALRDSFNVTIVYVTHDHEEAFALADEVFMVEGGKISKKC
jgi:ABC-type Fe3+/spermidine/putrescine transport system ATPase subunit